MGFIASGHHLRVPIFLLPTPAGTLPTPWEAPALWYRVKPHRVPVETSCPPGRESAALPVCVVALANRHQETGVNGAVPLSDVPQEFPLMVGCAACAGR